MTSDGSPSQPAEKVELEDKIIVETTDRPAAGIDAAEQFEFEVVGIVEDSNSQTNYAVCYSERGDEFIVTDDVGRLLTDDALAQDILNDFLEQAGEAEEMAEDESS
ncbi:MAG: hypothetical protein GIX02_08930 [Candidatus Eremiobacteraeota bacterium]|nr:hypothetical protein [Candidatus Eremiobacteraeota bacterium]